VDSATANFVRTEIAARVGSVLQIEWMHGASIWSDIYYLAQDVLILTPTSKFFFLRSMGERGINLNEYPFIDSKVPSLTVLESRPTIIHL
jgi:hypothetical protein